MGLQPFSFRIIVFILSFLYLIPSNNAAPANSFSNTITEFYVMLAIPLIFHSLNLLGTFYIFYRK
jgi:hypothetical protein